MNELEKQNKAGEADGGGRKSNGLGRLTGTWSEEEFREFEENMEHFSELDDLTAP